MNIITSEGWWVGLVNLVLFIIILYFGLFLLNKWFPIWGPVSSARVGGNGNGIARFGTATGTSTTTGMNGGRGY